MKTTFAMTIEARGTLALPKPKAASRPPTKAQAVAWATVLTLAAVSPALAQDTIGVQPVATAVIAAIKIIAVAAICFGFVRLMSGRHTMEGLVTMAIGGLGAAKTDAVASLFGLS